MPNLVFDTPTPPSQLYSTSTAQAVATSLKPRLQAAGQPIATSTVLPKSKLREQYRPEMDFDLDGSSSSSSDSTFSSADLVQNNNQRRDYYGRYNTGDENRPPMDSYHKSPGYGDVSMGLAAASKGDRIRFLDTQKAAAGSSPARRRDQLTTRVDEHSDATSDSRHHSMSSDSEDDWNGRGKSPQRVQQDRSLPNHQNVTSTPYPGLGSQSNNVSKSAFDGMARELKKEFERIMQAGQPITSRPHQQTISPAQTSGPSMGQHTIKRAPLSAASPSYVSSRPNPLPRGVPPKSLPTTQEYCTDRDLERTPTTRRTYTGAPAIAATRQSPVSSNPYENDWRKRSPQQTQSDTPRIHTAKDVHGALAGPVAPSNIKAASQPRSPSYARSHSQDNQYSAHSPVRVPDVTGITEGLISPSRVHSGPSSHRTFSTANRSGMRSNGIHEDTALTSALASLKARLEDLESENARSEAKIADLQDRLGGRAPVPGPNGTQTRTPQTQELTDNLQAEVLDLQAQLNQHHRLMRELQVEHSTNEGQRNDRHLLSGHWDQKLVGLGQALSHLAERIMDVRTVLEELLESLRNTTHASPRDKANDGPVGLLGRATADSPPLQPLKTSTHDIEASPRSCNLLQPDHRTNNIRQQHRYPSGDARPIAHHVPRSSLSHNPAQQATAINDPLLERAERVLSAMPDRVQEHTNVCQLCKRRFENLPNIGSNQGEPRSDWRQKVGEEHRMDIDTGRLPAQTVVARMLRELEEDFDVHKRIYIELSEEYKCTDAATPNVARRKLLANHLRDSIDVLEMKADEIKRLYDTLHYSGNLKPSEAMDARLSRAAHNLKTRYSATMQ